MFPVQSKSWCRDRHCNHRSWLLYIHIVALSLGMGVILYISSVNDEVAHRKKQPDGGTDGKSSFTYHYGWAFFFGGATFVCAMGAAVSNISLYLRRYSHFDDTLFIVPAAANIGASTSSASDGNGLEISAGYHPVRRVEMNDPGHVVPPKNRQPHEQGGSGGAGGVSSARWPTYENRKSLDSGRPVHVTPDYELTIPL